MRESPMLSPDTAAPETSANVARLLTEMAGRMAESVAVAFPGKRTRGKRAYSQISFRDLDEDSSRLAGGLRSLGVTCGMRLALLVRPSIDFISLVFALFKVGAVTILIDPGMGRRNLVRCLSEAEPRGLVAVPMVHVVRSLLPRKFPRARYNVCVGRPAIPWLPSLADLRRRGGPALPALAMQADDPAAIIFTTGSTGPPKGVLYSHGNFDSQVSELRDFYGIQPGEIDLPGFPLFGLFNAVMGVTTVIPDMDPTRPARVDPRNIIEAVRDWNVTQAFGSPAIWHRVGSYCEQHAERLETLTRVLSAGAPVPAHVLGRMKRAIGPQGDVHTPYGATEALPVASIAASEVLAETSAQTARGAGVCVGRKFPKIQWKVIEAVDGPVATIEDARESPPGKIGELIVSGPVVTRSYATRPQANALGKIADGAACWHRMGDVGYLDPADRFWFCGRMAHRVHTRQGPMYTVCCEAIYNQHADVFRTALVGIGPAGDQQPVIVVEPRPGRMPRGRAQRDRLIAELLALGRANPLTERIDTFLLHPGLPVDIRHNAKIFREQLAVWAATKLR